MVIKPGRLLLHSCCVDCALKFIPAVKQDLLAPAGITLFYYNPNIHPHSEFTARQMALKKLAKERKLKLIVPDWQPEEYFELIGSLVDQDKSGEPLKDKRCPLCWQLRLEKTFQFAQKNGYDLASTTMLASHYLNVEKITSIGQSLSGKYKIAFYRPEKIALKLKTSGFYKQNYCGCVYSLWERMTEKYLTKDRD